MAITQENERFFNKTAILTIIVQKTLILNVNTSSHYYAAINNNTERKLNEFSCCSLCRIRNGDFNGIEKKCIVFAAQLFWLKKHVNR